jgi:hypothetical protein
MLEIVNRMIKWEQDRDVCIVDFISRIKDYTSLLYRHFMNPTIRYHVDIFKSHIHLLEGCQPKIRTKWQISTGSKVEHFVFDVEPAYAYARYTCKETSALKFVTREVLDDAARAVKMQLTG